MYIKLYIDESMCVHQYMKHAGIEFWKHIACALSHLRKCKCFCLPVSVVETFKWNVDLLCCPCFNYVTTYDDRSYNLSKLGTYTDAILSI